MIQHSTFHQRGMKVLISPDPHNAAYYCPFDYSHSGTCEMISHCSFYLLMTSDTQHFLCVLAICICSLKKHLYRLLACFLIGAFIILSCSYECSLYYRHKFLIICVICKCFLPFSGMSLCFLCGIFWNTVLNFDESLSFFLLSLMPLVSVFWDQVSDVISVPYIHFTSVPFQSTVPSDLPS